MLLSSYLMDGEDLKKDRRIDGVSWDMILQFVGMRGRRSFPTSDPSDLGGTLIDV